MTSCIYKITNLVNRKFYIGSTSDSRVRFRQHRKLLRGNRHHCKHLQASWNKHGEDAFAFKIIEPLEPHLLEAREDEWLSKWYGDKRLYNTGRSAKAPWRGVPKESHPSFGAVRTEQQRADISRTLKEFYAADYFNHPRVGKKHTEESREKMRRNAAAFKGENHYRYGQTVSEEVRKKIGDTQRGVKKGPRTLTPEGYRKICEAAAKRRGLPGAPMSAELREKLSKRVRVVGPDFNQVFASVTAAAEHLKVPSSAIFPHLSKDSCHWRGKLKGWFFSYDLSEEKALEMCDPVWQDQKVLACKNRPDKKRCGRKPLDALTLLCV
jgi:group I intron endonuclease